MLATAAIYFAGGCYTFTAVQENPPVGTDVRATVTDEEALRLSRQTGDLSRSVEGRLVGVTDDSLVVSVVTFRAESVVSGSRQLRQSLVIPRSGLEELATRELSAWRTSVLGALGASAVAMVINQVVTGGSNDENPDNGLPTGALVPLLRVTIGR